KTTNQRLNIISLSLHQSRAADPPTGPLKCEPNTSTTKNASLPMLSKRRKLLRRKSSSPNIYLKSPGRHPPRGAARVNGGEPYQPTPGMPARKSSRGNPVYRTSRSPRPPCQAPHGYARFQPTNHPASEQAPRRHHPYPSLLNEDTADRPCK